ncbi:MAG: Gfo/Idh/MocA family oxidoreductase [Chloroflexi bacterium]|nr:Gfo/Idh/MocA family oxidoreductase [Chloroflexota bacterium]
MANKIRWGLLSTANINKALIDPIRAAERSELVAVASRDAAKATAYAQEYGIPKAYGSYEALLADPDVDVIYNPLPNTMHSEWTIKAAEAGKHVLCEKPLVTTLAEFDQVATAAQRHQVTIFEAFMYLHHPQTRKVQAMIAAGELGNVGVYPNSLSLVMAQAAGAGESPKTVWADKIVGETGVDVAMRAQLVFANNLVAQISSGLRTPFREAAHIIGDKGSIQLIEPWKPGINGQESRCIVTTIDGSTTTIITPAVNPYLCEVTAMEQCILDGAAPVVPLSLSRNFLRSALAIHQAAKTNQLVQL